MRSLYGIALAGALVVGLASSAKAQVSIAVGNPYGYGSGVVVGGSPFGYGGFAPGYGVGYPGLAVGGVYGVAPLTTVYRSGYYGGYGPRVYGGYGGGYGYRRGPGFYGRPYRRW